MNLFEPQFVSMVIQNVCELFLLFYVLIKIPNEPIKFSYLSFLIVNMIYVNLVYLIKYTPLSFGTAEIVSSFIFASSCLNIIFMGIFIFIFYQRIEEFKTLRFKIFLIVNLISCLFSFIPGLIVLGITENSEGYAPIHGPLHPVFVFCTVVSAAYVFSTAYLAYKKEKSEIIKYQYKILFFTGMLTAIFMIFTNGVVPAIFKTSKFAFFGTLGSLIFFTGGLNILINEKNLFIKKEFNKFIKLPPFQQSENIFALRELFSELNNIFRKNPERVKARLNFVGQDSEDLNLLLLRKNEKLGVDGKLSIGSVPPGWYQGMIDSISKIYEDNRQMAFTLLRAEGQLGEEWLSRKVDHLKLNAGLPEKGFHVIRNYEKALSHSIEENRETFRQEVLCFSLPLKKILQQMFNYSVSSQIVTFAGESGVGKTLLVKCLHSLRHGGSIMEISCLSASPDRLRSIIRNFVEEKQKIAPDGILIKHIDYLPAEYSGILEPLLQDFRKTRFVYFTCSSDFIGQVHEMPQNILMGIKQLPIIVPPLRDRKEDIFFQVIYYLKKYSKQYHRNYEAISTEMMDYLSDQSWTGNTQEVINTIQHLVLNGDSRVLDERKKLIGSSGSDIDTDLPDLTPLEFSERNVIIKYLQTNKYNKNRTRKQLGITINTLNAKIELYKIKMPE